MWARSAKGSVPLFYFRFSHFVFPSGRPLHFYSESSPVRSDGRGTPLIPSFRGPTPSLVPSLKREGLPSTFFDPPDPERSPIHSIGFLPPRSGEWTTGVSQILLWASFFLEGQTPPYTSGLLHSPLQLSIELYALRNCFSSLHTPTSFCLERVVQNSIATCNVALR